MTDSKKEIFLLNDSFPPAIDGVANAVVNYAEIIQKSDSYSPCVVTPDYPGADDSKFTYPVVRYPSIDLREKLGYTAGIPFEPQTITALKKRDAALLHSHCPMASNFLARTLREQLDVPLVMTYHTKFDIDIANAIRSKTLQQGAIKALVESVNAVDELWVVSKGAGENIRSLGYSGDYIVMQNGVDMPRRRSDENEIAKYTSGYDLPAGVPTFLFVGRLMWYKGLKIIIDALAALRSRHLDFRMVFIGKCGDEKAVRAYAAEHNLSRECIFTGPVYDRNELTSWYSRADLFLFPSTFDTNGLVVREAAACSLGTVMIGGSCAAEGVTDGVNGLFIEENAASLAVCLARIMDHREAMRTIGENASRDLYISWETAVGKAMERYNIVIDRYKSGEYRHKKDFQDMAISLGSDILDTLGRFHDHMQRLEDRIGDRIERFERYL